MRTLPFDGPSGIAFRGTNRSLHYARHWLGQIGLPAEPLEAVPDPSVVLLADADAAEARTHVVLWDFQVDLPGTGFQASAASGVSWVLGRPNGPPLALPAHLPEKWCGLIAANLAVTALLEAELHGAGEVRRYDISAADTLRAFAHQNAGDADEVARQWQRNGSIAKEHGGIFPQGFFPCKDGHVALIGRSRKDWLAIRAVIGHPPWSREPEYENPFALARDPDDAETRLAGALLTFDRDELLARALEHGATLAPLYAAHELAARNVVRPDFFDEAGTAQLPFRIVANA